MAKKFDAKGEGQEAEDHRGGARCAAPRRARLRGAVADEVDEQEASGGQRRSDPCPGCSSRGRRPRRRRSPPPCLSPRLLPIPTQRPRPGVGSSCRSTDSRARTRSSSRWTPRPATTPRRCRQNRRKATQPKVPSTTPTTPSQPAPSAQPQHGPDLGQRHERTGRPRQDLPLVRPGLPPRRADERRRPRSESRAALCRPGTGPRPSRRARRSRS